MTGFNRQTLMSAVRRHSAESDAEWRQKIRSERDKMMLPPVVPQPEQPPELLACVLYNTPAWQAAREAAQQVEAATPESKRPRQRRAKGESEQ